MQVGSVELLSGPAGIIDDLDAGAVYLLQALETIPAGTPGDGGLTGTHGGSIEERDAPALHGDGHTAHPDVEFFASHLGQQRSAADNLIQARLGGRLRNTPRTMRKNRDPRHRTEQPAAPPPGTETNRCFDLSITMAYVFRSQANDGLAGDRA